MIIPWQAVIPFALLGLAAATYLVYQRLYITVGPDEYVVHYRAGKVKHIGRGISFVCLPHDTYIKVPGTLRDVNFVADQITKEKQGVRVQGFLAYKIADFEKAYQNLDLRSGIIRTLPKIEDNVKNKDFETKNKETVVRLDPNDPLAKTDEILRRLAESVVRHEVSNKTLDEMITERETVVQSMREQILATVTEWGLSVDTIEFAEVWIRSRELFEHLQADYRNSVRLAAQNSTSETNKEIAAKQLDSDKSIAMMTAAAEREKRVIASQEELLAAEAELANQRSVKEKEAQVRLHLQLIEKENAQKAHLTEVANQELAKQREAEARHKLELLEKENKQKAHMAELANLELAKQREAEGKQKLELFDKENRHRTLAAELALAHEREIKASQNAIENQANQHQVSRDRQMKDEEMRLAEARADAALSLMSENAKIEQAELDRKREAVLAQTLLDQKENEAKQSEIALGAEVKRMQDLAAAQLAKAKEEAQAILEIGRAEAEATRLKIEAQNAVSSTQLQEQLIARLPEIAHSMRVKDIHWVNMAGSNGESPMGLVPKNILELMTVLSGFGIDLKGLLGNGKNSAQAPAVVVEDDVANKS